MMLFYIFGSADGTPIEMRTTGPAVEFNWGAIPRIQLGAILPLGSIIPSNNPAYLPAGTGPSAFGPINAETGIKRLAADVSGDGVYGPTVCAGTAPDAVLRQQKEKIRRQRPPAFPEKRGPTANEARGKGRPARQDGG